MEESEKFNDTPWTILLRGVILFMAGIAAFDILRLSLRSIGLPESPVEWGIQLYALFGLLGCMVSGLLAVRWPRGSPPRLLALGLASAASIWTTRLQVVLDPDFRDFFRWAFSRMGLEWFGGELISSLVLWTGVAAFLRFSALFPRPIQKEEYYNTDPPQGDDPLARVNRKATEGFYSLFGKFLKGGGEILTRPIPGKNPISMLWALSVDPRWVWGIALTFGIGFSPALLGGLTEEGLWFYAEAFVCTLGVMGCWMNFFQGFDRASPEDRRRLLWVWYGFFLGFLALMVPIFGMLFWEPARYLFATYTLDYAGQRAVFPFIFGFPAPWIMLALLIATFYSGEFDPSLAIRKTSVFGTLGVLFLFLFAGFGNAAEGFLESSIGLPPVAGSVVTGGTIAVILIPVKRRMDRFVNRILPATVLAEAPTQTLAIVFSDIVGYTRLTGEDQARALTLISVFHKVVDRLAREHRGRVVKTVADEALLVFDDTTRAVRAAAELRGDFQEETKRLGLPTPDLRTGLHRGTVTLSHDGDVFGDAVNLASKIHTSAEPGQVVLSAAVRERLEDGAFELVSLGARELKNVAEPVEVFGMAMGRDK